MRIPGTIVAVVFLATSWSTHAAPCGGFVDVDSVNPATAPFCANVDWIKNRAITLGCAANLFCPNESVTRLQMAAFMNRLGNSLIHRLVIWDQQLATLDLTSGKLICLTNPEEPASYERRVAMSGRVSAASSIAGPSSFYVSLVYTSDNGATLTGGGGGAARVTSPDDATWVTAAAIGSASLDPGVTYRFGIHVQPAVAAPDLTGVSCALSADIRPKDIDD